MAARQYQEEVPLLKHITADDVVTLAEYICKATGLVEVGTTIETDDGSINDDHLAGALAALEPGDDVRAILVNFSDWLTMPNDFYVHLAWFVTLEGDESLSSIQVTGPDRIRVLGVAGATRQFIAKTLPAPATPAEEVITSLPEISVQPYGGDAQILPDRTWWRGLAGWWRRKRDDLGVEVVGGLILLMLTVAVTGLWAVFFR